MVKVFVTGATGYIGSIVVEKLVKKGFTVVGLSRTADKAKDLEKLGATPLVGDIRDTALLEKTARESDGVIHLGFIHDFANFEASVKTDIAASEAFGRALKGTNKPVISSGVASTVGDTSNKIVDDGNNPRVAAEHAFLNLAKDGIRSVVIKLPGFVYGRNGSHFFPAMIDVAKKQGAALYIGDGSKKSVVVHVDDTADLYIAAFEKGVAGASYIPVGQNDVSFKEFAEAIGKLLNVPVRSITPEEGLKTFGPLIGHIFNMDLRCTSGRSEKDLGWKPNPKNNDVIEDLVNGSYKVRAN